MMSLTTTRKISLGILGLVVCSAGLGCNSGKKTSEPKAATESPATDSASTPAEKSGSATTGGTVSGGENSADRKYVQGIPYDVFYDRPLSIAAENQQVMTAAPVTTPSVNMTENMAASPATAPETTPAPASASASSTPVADWGSIISKEALIAEVMRIRNSLSGNLNSVGNYNRELLTIQADAAVLAALAGVATQYDADFTWKPNAKYVRDFSYIIAMAAETRGRSAFETAEKPFLNIVEILDGGTPAELPDSDEETVFSDIAERNMLMKQVNINAEWLRTTISTPAELKSKKDEIISKATVLATIGKVIKEEDYVFADEEEYQAFCQELVDGSLKMVQAAAADNFEDYRAGIELMNSSCNKCHPKYLNN